MFDHQTRYEIHYESERGDNESENTKTSAEVHTFLAPNILAAQEEFTKFCEDVAFSDECAEAMGGGCFSFSTNIIGLKAQKSKEWIVKCREPQLEEGQRENTRRWGKMTPYGRRDEYGGL